MDTSGPGGHTSDTRHRIRFPARLPGLGIVWTWIAGLIRLTKEEEEAAGIYLGD